MKRLHSPAAVSALALCLAFAAPALAQQAPVQAAPAQPAPQAAAPAAVAENGDNEEEEEARPERNQRRVSGRDLMTREERRSFRRQMEAATPEEQQVLWDRTHADLQQRAARRGEVLVEPRSRAGGWDEDHGKGRGNRAESGRGERGGWVVILVTRQAPHAP